MYKYLIINYPRQPRKMIKNIAMSRPAYLNIYYVTIILIPNKKCCNVMILKYIMYKHNNSYEQKVVHIMYNL